MVDFTLDPDSSSSTSTSTSSSPSPDLSPRELKFIEAYLGPANCNAYRAMLMIGTKAQKESSRRSVAAQMLAKPRVQAEIRRRFRENGIGPEEVVKRLADQGRIDILDFVRLDEEGLPFVDLRRAKKAGNGTLVKKFKTVKDTKAGRTFSAIEMHDSQKALIILAKIHGLLALDLPGAEEGAISVLTDAEARAAREAILRVRGVFCGEDSVAADMCDLAREAVWHYHRARRPELAEQLKRTLSAVADSAKALAFADGGSARKHGTPPVLPSPTPPPL